MTIWLVLLSGSLAGLIPPMAAAAFIDRFAESRRLAIAAFIIVAVIAEITIWRAFSPVIRLAF